MAQPSVYDGDMLYPSSVFIERSDLFFWIKQELPFLVIFIALPALALLYDETDA